MNLTILGTGNAAVTKIYNTCFVLREGKDSFLVDGGGGNTILSRLDEAGVSLNDIHTIFVTHKHMDHLFGILWVMRMICQKMTKGAITHDVTLYAHDELITLLRDLTKTLLPGKHARFLDEKLHLIEVKDGEKKEILRHETTFFDIHSTKAKQFGFTMQLGNGEKLTCCGDEPYNEADEAYVKDSTWLLHEAFCLYSQADKYQPYEKHHSTVKDACELAERLHVKNLLLYHTEDDTITQRKELYGREGSAVYQGNLFIPDDMETFVLE